MENCFWAAAGDQYGSSWNYTQQSEAAAAAALQYHFYHHPGGQPWEGAAGDRTASASRSHSEAEKRRRDRINAQLATLRKLIPKSEKMDKAALLGHVVDHVKEQSKLAKEVSKSSTIPTETDEVTIDVHSNDDDDDQHVYMKASICCDDRPELFAELNGAVKGVGLTIHQAEITSIGGRMKSNLVLCAKDKGAEQNTCTDSLKQSLKLALSRVVITSGASSYTARSKRQRFFYPNYR
ncbi:transcription factor bhlh51 [Phtheirospermum japonicum]|uniref:Transcription factor bhlh51 n=1 Tax=Phtheirospermum japonicum TaxID=374723 RepID=A0A830CZT7_9LAMI|nr:transcription factor bhlh51 [Phtheirospermum japonicum]